MYSQDQACYTTVQLYHIVAKDIPWTIGKTQKTFHTELIARSIEKIKVYEPYLGAEATLNNLEGQQEENQRFRKHSLTNIEHV